MKEITGKRSSRSKSAANDREAKSARSSESQLEHVATAAYYRAEARGFAPGFELEDWLGAEADLAQWQSPQQPRVMNSSEEKPQ